jgi:cytosine/adenosine deaminase-related metal-dependent hydrolase
LSCSAPQRVTPEYFQSLSDLARRFDLPLNVHVLETRLQRVLGDQKFGKSLVRYMQDLGVLDDRVQLIHGIWIDDADIKLIAQSRCTVAHNPVCNLRLGSGIMPYAKLRAAGVPMSIGTDEMCTDDTPNLWFAGKTAALVHTMETVEYLDWPKADEILQAMTQGGARALRRNPQLGQLVEGAPADIILVDLDTWHFTPLNDLKRQLIYCEDGSSVRYTMVNGNIVYELGNFPQIDEPAIRREIRELSTELHTQFHALDIHARKLMPYYRRMYLQAQAAYSGPCRTLPSE